MSHAGIATGCALCHDSTVTSFGTLAVPRLVIKPAKHIPTSATCETCHPASQTNVGGFVLPITGMNHAGISTCSSCHNGQRFVNVTPVAKSSNHISTSQDCSVCHHSTQIPGGFALAPTSFDHVKAGVQPGSCTSCHNGISATGMIAGHIAVNTAAQCDSCHSFTLGTFQLWTMDHSKVSAACSNCHATGSTYPGATMVTIGSVNHFPTTAQCSSCHTSQVVPGGFKTWTMNHSAVTATVCSTCHDTGKSYSGSIPIVTKPASGHIATTAACDQCHTSTVIPGGFKTWTMNHSVVAATACSTCHNTGVSFLPGTPPLVTKPTGTAHIPTTAVCDSCHTSTVVTGGFAQWTMNHTGITSGCNSCHGTATQLFSGVVNQPVGHMATGTQDCVKCHINTNPGGFAIAIGGVNPHTITQPNTTCTNCHGKATATFPFIPAPGQVAGHITVNSGVQCGACHNWSAPSFAGWSMDHTKVSTTCASCHAIGKTFPGIGTMVTNASTTHIPITGDCSVCHSVTTIPGGFKTWTMNHSGVSTSACATCHGAGKSFPITTGPALKNITSVTHIPVTGDCSVCHTNTTVTGGFATWTMNHSGVAATPCAICHGASAASFTNTSGLAIKTTASVTHIPVTGDCSVCHSSTTVTGGFKTWTMNHSGVTATPCSTCHAVGKSYTNTGGKALVTQPANHFPITGDCAVCHGSAYTRFVIPSPYSSMVHVGGVNVTSCKTCHGDTPVTSWYGISPVAKSAYPSTIHSGTTADCSTCHSNFTVPGGFAVASGHTHSAADNGKCYSCHNGSGTGKPQISGHIPTSTTSCDSCHSYSSLNFAVPVSMNHAAVTATACSSCHKQTGNQTIGTSSLATVVGKPANHIATTAECSTCHSNQTIPGGFKTWTMNHSGVSIATCQNCHGNNTFATGVVPVYKPANHLSTTNDCYVCHSSTTSFKLGSMSHAGISSGCQNCHNGQVFQGVTPVSKPATHIATLASTTDCAICHTSTATFTLWTMNHSGVTATPCSTCHAAGKSFTNTGGKALVTQPVNHFPITGDCLVCHGSAYTSFVIPSPYSSMVHVGGVNVTSCKTCHGDTPVTSWYGISPVAKSAHPSTIHSGTTADCSTCHNNFTVPGGFAVPSAHTHSTSDNGKCYSCHNGSGTGKPQISGHIPTGTTSCDSCHSYSSLNFALPVSMNHAAVTATACSSCHKQTGNQTIGTSSLATVVGKPTTHITTTAECSTCHSNQTIPGGFKTWTMNHSGVNTSACATCHGAGKSFPITTGPALKTISSVTHIPVTGDCSVCHTNTTVTGGFATWTMNHSGVNTGTCATCHGASAASFTNTSGLAIKTTASVTHIPVTGDCSVCHSSTTVTGGFKTWSMNHSGVIATPCSTCHAVGKSYTNTGGKALVTQPANHFPITGDCLVCHGSAYASFVIPSPYSSMVHVGGVNVTTCKTCHGDTPVTSWYGISPVAKSAYPSTIHSGTTADCSTCHSNFTVPGGFAVASGHTHSTADNGKCYSCHNGSGTGKPQISGHIPTGTTSCDSCHSYSGLNFALPVSMNHSVVAATGCSTCHKQTGNQTIGTSSLATLIGKPSSHIPTTAECSTCHSNQAIPGGFQTWTMNHSGVNTSVCATCHGAGKSFPITTGPALKTITSVTHIPVIGDCSVCHTNTTVTGGFSTWTMNHSGVNTGTCATCHGASAASFTNTSGLAIKTTSSVTHIPVTGDCSVCHTNTTVTGGFATWTMNHSGVTTAPCSTCHAAGKSFTITGWGLLITQPGNHFPITGDCAVCHGSAYTSFVIPSPYLSMVHVGGVNVTTCKTCHGDTPVISWYGVWPVAKSAYPSTIHSGTTADCSTCHSNFTVPGGFAVASGHTHSAADNGKCYSCHNGSGTGKPQISGHIPTSTTSCDSCHSYSSLNFAVPVAMNHSVVAATGCSTCHKQSGNQTIGTSSLATVIGKPANHITTTAECSTCHSNQTIPGGFKIWTMNHSGVSTATCKNCHGNNTFATGVVPVYKPANHLLTTNDCYVCHSSTTTFKTGSMSHTGITSGCQNCHNGQVYQGVTPVSKPATHIATLAANTDCAVCHSSTTTFTLWTMNHSGVSTTTCTNCHGGQTFATGVIPVAKASNHIATTKDCNTCHGSTTTFIGGRMGTTEHIANGNTVTCNGCHTGQAFQGVTPVAKPANHITTALDCSTCHSKTNFSTFVGTWTMSHTGITTNCMSCHNGQSFATGVIPVYKGNTPSPGHVPTASDCSNCHTSTSTGGFAVKPATLGSKHATLLTGFSTSTCYPTCHGTTAAIYFGVDYQALKSQSSHNPLGTRTNCTSCHSYSRGSW